MTDGLTRRDVLRKSLTLAVIAVGAPALAACSKSGPKELHCDDTTGLPPADIEARKALAYVDKSPDPNKQCQNCQQYVAPPAANQCGSCKVVKGTVNPVGYCKSWAAKQT